MLEDIAIFTEGIVISEERVFTLKLLKAFFVSLPVRACLNTLFPENQYTR